MSARAQASGAVGSVIDGRFRDLQEQRDLNYPVRLSLVPAEHGLVRETPVLRDRTGMEDANSA